MSGRRSSSADGSSDRDQRHRDAPPRPARSRSSAGGLPISTAIACSNWARVTPTAISCARVASSCASAWSTADWSAVPPAYWLLVICSDWAIGLDRGVEQALQLVGDAQLADSRWRACPAPTAARWRDRRRWPGRSRHRFRRCGGSGPRDRGSSSPMRRGLNRLLRILPAAGRPCSLTEPPPVRERLRASVQIDGREKAGARLGDDRLGLAEGRLGGFQVLVRDVDLPLEPVEHRIVVDRPPRAAVDRVGRLAGSPARLPGARLPGLLVGGRHRRVGRADNRARRCRRRSSLSSDCGESLQRRRFRPRFGLAAIRQLDRQVRWLIRPVRAMRPAARLAVRRTGAAAPTGGSDRDRGRSPASCRASAPG